MKRTGVGTILVRTLVLAATLILLSTPAFAWQLGTESYDAKGASGVRSTTEVVGENAGGWLSSTAFTDTNSYWHNIVLIAYANSQTVGVEAEYGYQGNYHDYVICSIGQGYVTNEIILSQTKWIYESTGCSNYWSMVESGSVNSNGEYNFMEASDCNANDFSNNKAMTFFSPTLQYYSTSQVWANSIAAYSLVAGGSGCSGPPSTLGLSVSCSTGGTYVESTSITNNNPPPPPNNKLMVNC